MFMKLADIGTGVHWVFNDVITSCKNNLVSNIEAIILRDKLARIWRWWGRGGVGMIVGPSRHYKRLA
jgi:hypothetical protein